mgnify:CR=1 FL=1
MAVSAMSDGGTLSKVSQKQSPKRAPAQVKAPESVSNRPNTSYQFSAGNFSTPEPGFDPYAPSNFTMDPSGDLQFEEAMGTLKGMGDKPSNWGDMSTESKMGVAQQAMGTMASAAATAESKTSSQAVVGGLTTGVSAGLTAASMASVSALAATGVGAVVAAGAIVAGMNSAKQAKNRAADEQKKREKQAQRAEEIRLLGTYQNRRDKAMQNLSAAFRRR